ncbi:energy transducer TonB [Tenacibaculum mesophilum]|uniref:M56 family metallopeptidase n=1 Tax=Tenacibaculum mesophilum TaxID=104268 RepID=UPI001431F23A|nr:M56 family metallopeptidase [Tenacibaculum mesophilum]KAF9658691.1 energy transducer TonB [Tenacibaculum mesophilum]
MINYIIQVVLFQVLFVAVYDFFLSKETFFNKNRWYLLSTALLSFVLPLFKISTVQKAVPQEYYTLLPEVVLSPQKVIEKAAWYQSINYLDVLFLGGCILFFIVFLVKLERIIRLVLRYGTTRKDNYKLIFLPKETKAFSFFNYIFLGKDIPSSKQEKIIQHELVHSEQKHTLDLLFFEFLKIIMWFNPMVYVCQNRISLVHEYISDAVASKSDKKENYINHLLADIFQVEHISFINQFYKHSLIKKRIIMMTKTQSKKVKQLKYLLLIPLLGSMILYTACSSVKLSEKRSKNIIKENMSEVEDVPFSSLDKAPTFPGCEEGDRKCFNLSMMKFVKKNFNVKLADSIKEISGKKRIYALFKIGIDGRVFGFKVRAPHPELKTHTIDMLKKLPQMKPGEKNGKIVRTGFVLPITF